MQPEEFTHDEEVACQITAEEVVNRGNPWNLPAISDLDQMVKLAQEREEEPSEQTAQMLGTIARALRAAAQKGERRVSLDDRTPPRPEARALIRDALEDQGYYVELPPVAAAKDPWIVIEWRAGFAPGRFIVRGAARSIEDRLTP